MTVYLLRRCLLLIPTLLGILLVNFALVQLAPGGPAERLAAREAADGMGQPGLSAEDMAALNRQFGFDRPAPERFWTMVKNYARFDLGRSFFRDRPVAALIFEKLPVSISLGLWSTMLIYLISIPLGIAKAVRDGSPFDAATSTAVLAAFAIPPFLFAVLFLVFFAGGSGLDWFPLRGLVSDNWRDLSWPARIGDYLWHIMLPVLAMTLGGFAPLTFLTKHSFLEEIRKQYVITARAKGASPARVLYGHVFRNAMLIVIAGLPAALAEIFLTGSVLIETIFSIDGLGLLGFESVYNRDYPVVFGTLFLFTLIGLALNIARDAIYALADPRIDFAARQA